MSGNPKVAALTTIRKSAKEYELEMPFKKGFGTAQAADMLQAHFAEMYGEDDLVACGECGYAGPEDVSACPFCDAEFDSEDDDGIVEVDETVKPEPAPEPKKTKKAKSPAKKKGGKVKKAKSPAKKKKRGRPSKADEMAEIEVSTEMKVEADKIVARINENFENVAVRSWEIGSDLRKLSQNPALIKARGCVMFTELVEKEFKFGGMRNAQLYMELATFDRDTAAQLGTAKAHVLHALPDDERKKMTDKVVSEGLSVRDLQKSVGNLPSGGTGKNPPKSGTTAPPFEQKITLVGRVANGPEKINFEEDDEGMFIQYEVVTGIDQRLIPLFTDDGELKGIEIEFIKLDPPVVVEAKDDEIEE